MLGRNWKFTTSHSQCQLRSLALLVFFEHVEWLHKASYGRFRCCSRQSITHFTLYTNLAAQYSPADDGPYWLMFNHSDENYLRIPANICQSTYTLASNDDAGKASLTSLYIPTLLLNFPVLMLVHTIVDVPITPMVSTCGYQLTSVIVYDVYTPSPSASLAAALLTHLFKMPRITSYYHRYQEQYIGIHHRQYLPESYHSIHHRQQQQQYIYTGYSFLPDSYHDKLLSLLPGAVFTRRLP